VTEYRFDALVDLAPSLEDLVSFLPKPGRKEFEEALEAREAGCTEVDMVCECAERSYWLGIGRMP